MLNNFNMPAFLASKQFYFYSDLKILGHGNPENYIESAYICIYLIGCKCPYVDCYVSTRVVLATRTCTITHCTLSWCGLNSCGILKLKMDGFIVFRFLYQLSDEKGFRKLPVVYYYFLPKP
jgi:hypothetical protein